MAKQSKRHSQAGPCKSTLLANDKSLGKLIVGRLQDEGVPICLVTSATDLGIETAAEKRRCAANQWKRIWKGRRRAKRVNRLCKINSEAQKLTMTGIQPVQVYGHTAQGAFTAQVNAMCKNLKMGTVMGKTQACAISSPMVLRRAPFPRSHVFSVNGVCHKLPPESNKSASGSQCGDVSMSIQGAEFVRSEGKRLPLWQQTTDAGTKRQVQPLPPFARCRRRAGSRAHQFSGKRQTASATRDGALFNKAQIIDSVSKDMEMQTWKRAAGHSLSMSMEKGITTDFAKKARSTDQRGKFHGCTCAGFSCVEPTNLICLRMDLFPTNFSVFVATRDPWPPGSMNCRNVLKTT